MEELTDTGIFQDLKPCPLCTSDKVRVMKFEDVDPTYYRIECQICGVKHDDRSRGMVFLGWDKRPGSDSLAPHGRTKKMERTLAWVAECELATLARYERLSSSSKRETERHREICKKLVNRIAELGVEPEGINSACTRLEDRLNELSSNSNKQSDGE